jgi:hypothetical protein
MLNYNRGQVLVPTKLLPSPSASNGGSFLGLFSLELDRLGQSDRKKAAHCGQSIFVDKRSDR